MVYILLLMYFHFVYLQQVWNTVCCKNRVLIIVWSLSYSRRIIASLVIEWMRHKLTLMLWDYVDSIILDHPQCRTQKIPIGHQSTFSNSICSPSGSRSRSTSLPRSPPLSSTPYLPHLLSLEVNQTKNKDLHRSNVKKKVIAKTLDPSLNHPSPTNTMQIKNREYDQASNDEVCSDDNNTADPRQYTYEKKQSKTWLVEAIYHYNLVGQYIHTIVNQVSFLDYLKKKKTILSSEPKRYRLDTNLHLVIVFVVLLDHDPVQHHFLVPLLYHLHHIFLISYL